MRSAKTRLAGSLLVASLAFGARAAGAAPTPTPTPDKKLQNGPPFDVYAETPHHITMALDTGPARDLLKLLAGGEGSTAALKRLKESRAVALALEAEGIRADDFFGRAVATAAGTPDSLLGSYLKSSGRYISVLDALEEKAQILLTVAARRLASILPVSSPVTSDLVVVPFLGAGGFSEVVATRDGDTLYLLADLPRLVGDALSPPPPREVMLALVRAVCSEAWKDLFTTHFRKPPAWPEEKEATFDALLSASVATGPPALFLVPDEFFPIGLILDEPIGRAFARWNRAVELLVDPAVKDPEKRDAILDATRGDFWRRYGTVVGAFMADELIRRAGREAYLEALAKGPRAVVSLYAERAKGAKIPQLGPAAKKALERPRPTPTPTVSLNM